MQTLVFSILGSSDDVYRVTFEEGGGKVHAFCTCQAGQNGMYCKHRFWLMNGEYDRMVNSNTDDLARLRDMLKGSELEKKYNAVAEAESAYLATKRRLDAAKHELARAMYR